MPQDGFTQRVVPLFETLADLRSAGASLRRLLTVPWYRRLLQCASHMHCGLQSCLSVCGQRKTAVCSVVMVNCNCTNSESSVWLAFAGRGMTTARRSCSATRTLARTPDGWQVSRGLLPAQCTSSDEPVPVQVGAAPLILHQVDAMTLTHLWRSCSCVGALQMPGGARAGMQSMPRLPCELHVAPICL